MKNCLFLVLLFSIVKISISQVPQAVNYQAIARDGGGNPLAHRTISVRFTINQGINPGVPEYEETQTLTTNQFGLFTAKIGEGTVVTGTFPGITWSTGNKYLLVEYDPNGGTNFVNMGSTELVSVPYALYAATSGGTSTHSTNSFAKQLLSNSRPVEGTVILAKEQFAGRGQMGNSWKAESGKNITLSVVLYPDHLDADKQFFLNMAVSLAVKDFCEFVLGDEIKIKWPNDIYYHDKKVGGILIENSVSGSKIASSVIGIGINVNQEEFDESLPNPTSLIQIRKPTDAPIYDISKLVEELCACLEKYYLQLRQQHYNFLDKGYTVALYRYQQTHEFKRGESTIKGEINGVAKDGKLIIHSGGKELRFGFKEVEYII